MNDVFDSAAADRSQPGGRNGRTPRPLKPVAITRTAATLARGMEAGAWVFATGQCGTDYVHGMAPEVTGASHPLNGEPPCKREARRLFRNVEEVLAEAGAGLADVVRIDQFYTGAHAVDPYHEVRREVFKGRIPPSTSNLHQRFARRGQTIEAQVMAVVPGKGLTAEHQAFTPSYKIHHSSGYSPSLAAGDFRFVPGQTAEARREEEGPIDPEARRPVGLWKGTPIKLETDFIIRRKMQPSLQAAGADLDSVVKAQVFLRDRDDVPAFNEVWHTHFKTPPATTIIPTAAPGFIMPDSRIEINVVALAKDGATGKEVIGGATPLFDGSVAAVRAGDLLFLSGLMAVEDGRLIEEAAVDPEQPFFAQPVKAELASIIRQAEAICAAAGTSLRNAVRIQQFHTDLAGLAPALEVWSEALGGQPLPISAIEVPWLPVPGAQVLADIWVYAPNQA